MGDKVSSVGKIVPKKGQTDMELGTAMLKDYSNYAKNQKETSYSATFPDGGKDGNCNTLSNSVISKNGATIEGRKKEEIVIGTPAGVSRYYEDNVSGKLRGFEKKLDDELFKPKEEDKKKESDKK